MRQMLLCTLLVAALAATASAAEDWPNFRGPRFDGVSTETGMKLKWDKPIPVVWEAPIGSAYSAFAIVDGKAYTTGTTDGKQQMYCFDAASGEELWRSPIEDGFSNNWGDGARATPTISDGRVYILGARGRLVCFDAENGEEIWSRAFNNAPKWGYSGSVLVEGNMAVVAAGGSDGSLIAFDKTNGERIWRSGDEAAGYATPYPFTFNGERYIVGFLGEAAIIVRAKDGREVWRMKWPTSYEVNAASPIFHDGYLFLGSGYRQGSILLKLAADGERISHEVVWRDEKLLTKFQSCVLYNGHMYVSDERALLCIEFETGTRKWYDRGIKNSTVVIAQDHIFVLTEHGELQIAPATPEDYKPLTEAELMGDRNWTVPVLYDGKIYVRNLKRAAVFNLKP